MVIRSSEKLTDSNQCKICWKMFVNKYSLERHYRLTFILWLYFETNFNNVVERLRICKPKKPVLKTKKHHKSNKNNNKNVFQVARGNEASRLQGVRQAVLAEEPHDKTRGEPPESEEKVPEVPRVWQVWQDIPIISQPQKTPQNSHGWVFYFLTILKLYCIVYINIWVFFVISVIFGTFKFLLYYHEGCTDLSKYWKVKFGVFFFENMLMFHWKIHTSFFYMIFHSCYCCLSFSHRCLALFVRF